MPHVTSAQTILRCDKCKEQKTLQTKTREQALTLARENGWSFGPKAACTCKKCRIAK